MRLCLSSQPTSKTSRSQTAFMCFRGVAHGYAHASPVAELWHCCVVCNNIFANSHCGASAVARLMTVCHRTVVSWTDPHGHACAHMHGRGHIAPSIEAAGIWATYTPQHCGVYFRAAILCWTDSPVGWLRTCELRTNRSSALFFGDLPLRVARMWPNDCSGT